jgi:hypothetical protein
MTMAIKTTPNRLQRTGMERIGVLFMFNDGGRRAEFNRGRFEMPVFEATLPRT